MAAPRFVPSVTDEEQKAQADALREMARHRGYRLVLSRRRKRGGDRGKFGLEDASGKKMLGFSVNGFTASADEIEAFLRGGEIATWKGSLKTSGAAKPVPSKKRPTAKPDVEPEKPAKRAKPEPPARARERTKPEKKPDERFRVREADAVDAEPIAVLLGELGYEVESGGVADRIALLARAGEPPLVARRGEEILGCLSWHVTPVIHRPLPVGRITMLVVAESERKKGIGRLLVEAAFERLRQRRCGLVEVTSNVKRSGAHAFYRRLGFERTSYRFVRELGD